VRVDAGEIGEASVELRVFVEPEVMHRIEVLVGDRAAMFEVGTDRAELRLEVSNPDSQYQAAVAEYVETRNLFREYHGVPLRQDHDAGCDPQCGRVRGCPRERDERVERRILRSHR